jgi:hypothetical protein
VYDNDSGVRVSSGGDEWSCMIVGDSGVRVSSGGDEWS